MPQEPTIIFISEYIGSDDYGDGSKFAPYRTLERALKEMGVRLEAGVLSEEKGSGDQ